ncbi:MAG: type II toxin-antitoxin system VapC family toxin [Verrucomicrobiota bacterium JB022]|nr:type II toxin-antitoxin system VapC family toxin [Verrucomicrobiota bacterium JB022]
MIAFDTNYLVRFLTQDDPEQSAVVTTTIQAEIEADRQIRIYDLVLLETCWVLSSVYQISKAQWLMILENLLDDALFVFDDAARLRLALERYRQGKADFGDYLIWARAKTEKHTLLTFDKKLKRDL